LKATGCKENPASSSLSHDSRRIPSWGAILFSANGGKLAWSASCGLLGHRDHRRATSGHRRLHRPGRAAVPRGSTSSYSRGTGAADGRLSGCGHRPRSGGCSGRGSALHSRGSGDRRGTRAIECAGSRLCGSIRRSSDSSVPVTRRCRTGSGALPAAAGWRPSALCTAADMPHSAGAGCFRTVPCRSRRSESARTGRRTAGGLSGLPRRRRPRSAALAASYGPSATQVEPG
jgi:hypothetical protein